MNPYNYITWHFCPWAGVWWGGVGGGGARLKITWFLLLFCMWFCRTAFLKGGCTLMRWDLWNAGTFGCELNPRGMQVHPEMATFEARCGVEAALERSCLLLGWKCGMLMGEGGEGKGKTLRGGVFLFAVSRLTPQHTALSPEGLFGALGHHSSSGRVPSGQYVLALLCARCHQRSGRALVYIMRPCRRYFPIAQQILPLVLKITQWAQLWVFALLCLSLSFFFDFPFLPSPLAV